MTAIASLIHREYLEHRGAFLYAPAILLALFTLTVASALALNKLSVPINVDMNSALHFYEFGFLILGGLWMAYLSVALFFYYADAFSADRRNNSMLFWKSMPQSDFKILGSKMLAGMTLLPALIFVMLILTGIVLYGLTALAVVALPNLVVPGIGEFLASTSELGLFALVYLALALLWFAPFFGWVGMLSTAFGRWCIPLAFLIPGLAILAENIFVRGVAGIIGDLFASGGAPSGGFIASYLMERSDFGFGDGDWEAMFTAADPLSGLDLITRLVSSIDWAQMAGGLAVAALFVFIAAEYRRRVVVA